MDRTACVCSSALKGGSHMYFMIDPDLLRLEKMMTQIPHFPPPSSGLLIHISEETPASTSHNKLMRDTMRYIRNP